MKVPEISFYVKADFSEWTKPQHDLFFLFPTTFKTDKLDDFQGKPKLMVTSGVRLLTSPRSV